MTGKEPGDRGQLVRGSSSAPKSPVVQGEIVETTPVRGKLGEKVQELAARGELQKLQNWGKGLGVLHEVVKTGSVVVKGVVREREIEAQRGLVNDEIRKLEAKGKTKVALAETRTTTVRDHRQLIREAVLELIPLLLENHADASPELRAQLTTEVLKALPSVKIDLR